MEETKTYVEYLYPGAFFSESSIKEVESRDPKKLLKKLPTGIFAFLFFDQASKTTKIDGETTTVYGKRKNVSGKYYPNGEEFTLAEVQSWGKSHEILASNMKCNNWPKVVKTKMGNFQPLEKGDSII